MSHVTFSEWTRGRKLQTFGTNAGSDSIAFQRWRNFKEAFSPELVERAMLETSGKVQRIIDPFGGSGTTALAAQFLGMRPTTIELNPFLADLIEAKIATYNLEEVVKNFSVIMGRVRELNNNHSRISNAVPDTFVEPGVNGRFIFSEKIYQRISNFKYAISQVRQPSLRKFFRIHLGATLIPSSNVVVSGKGRRYRKNWEQRQIEPEQIDSLFEKSVLNALFDLCRFSNRRVLDYTLLRGDSRKLISQTGRMDIAVFSPPYPNSFDYTDVYNVELWALGYLKSSQANQALRHSTLRSHVQIKRDLRASRAQSRELKKTVARLKQVEQTLWDNDIPDMIAAYADDMHLILRRLLTRLRPQGRVYMVVGDSRYSGIRIPVAKILCEEATSIGYEIKNVERCRSMRSSPQQGGQKNLPENLIVLEKL